MLLLYYCVIILHEVYPVIFLHSSCLDTYCDLAPPSSIMFCVVQAEFCITAAHSPYL